VQQVSHLLVITYYLHTNVEKTRGRDCTEEYKYSWRKMKVSAQSRVEDGSMAHVPPGVTRLEP